MKRISSPIESRMVGKGVGDTLLEADVLIIGSGYGGAVAAMRLANGRVAAASEGADPIPSVVVLERGREYSLGDFPYDMEDLPSHVRMLRPARDPAGYPDALFHFHVGVDNADPNAATADQRKGGDKAAADVLVGSGLGGTSLINANVAELPEPHVFRKPAWPRQFRDAPDLLDTAYAQVASLLGVTTHTAAAGQPFPKYSALQRLGRALGHPARPAMISVTTEAVTTVAATSGAPSSTAQDAGQVAHTRTNKVGVEQSPCTNCGNCVTGCNVGAKNTLDRNLLRLAKSRGAEFYTGATVESIEPLPPLASDTDRSYRWKVMVRPTVKPTERPRANPDDPVVHDTYCILARKVILAAGALGSTGILLRSQQSGQLQLSAALGKKFSTNGDGISMSYGQRQRVGALARAEQKAPVAAVGPTITGIIRTGALTIEEASIPAALGRLFSEMVTTSAMLQRIAKRTLPPLLKDPGRDPLAASREVADHCQALLIMGDDGANGHLSLADKNNTLNIGFPHGNISDNSALKEANRLLRAQDRGAGLDGGQYAPNPLWQLLPPEATGVLSGSMPVRRVLTVHPLGGCAMADDVSGGVVNHCGQVFRCDGHVYDGLYVMDGSIIPTALEVNPFLTIAALAWRNVGLIPSSAKDAGCGTVDPEYADLGAVPRRHRSVPQPTQFLIQEQLTGQFDRLTPALTRLLHGRDPQRLLEKNGLVVQISASHDNAETWLDNPGAVPLQASLKLYANPLPLAQRKRYGVAGVHPSRLGGVQPLITLDGSFRVFAEDQHDCIADVLGCFNALKAYKTRRVRTAGWLPPGTGKDLLRNPVKTLKALWTAARTFINMAVLQSRFRRLSYAFGDRTSEVTIGGEKVIGYSLDIQRMWDGLLNLEVSVTDRDGAACSAHLCVNAEHLLEPGLLEVRKSAHLPQSLLFAGGLAAFVGRALFATNFWEFGGLVYRDAPRLQPEPAVLKTRSSGAVPPQPPEFFPVPLRAGSKDTIQLRLTRYHRAAGKPLLLLHGLAQGSQIFWLEDIYNLAAYFHDAGFDVWLLDYRLSNLVLPDLRPDQRNWSMDEIAQFDIPLAIARVCALTQHEKISVFGHCVGACTLAMAALRNADVGARIEAAVTNAIHPWVIASPANQFRAKLGNFYREWVPEDLLDPNPGVGAGGLQNLVDRLAFSVARMNEGKEDNHLEYGGRELEHSVCDRMSFLYGRMWRHENLDPTTHAAFPGMLGPAPASVYQHLYYHSSLRRITDANGENTYLTEGNIRNHWQFPILFIHGNDSCVFHPHSARRSAQRLHGILNAAPSTDGLDPEAVERIPVRFKIYPDYGHMDVVFGKDAHKRCFQDYVDFLRDPGAVSNSDSEPDWDETYAALPETGPILRAAWKNGDKFFLRLWAELRTSVTFQPHRLVVTGGREVAEFELEVPESTPKFEPAAVPRFRMVDVELTHTEAPIHLTLRGGKEDHAGYDGAELVYSEQAWWHRLRAGAGHQHRARMCFVVGSCRYPGSIVDNALSDSVYAAIQKHTVGAEGAQLLLLIGDQIYADATDQLIATQSPKARYTDRYHRAFGTGSSPLFARLVAQIPTHFALDDHERGDDWSGAPLDEQSDAPSMVLSGVSRTDSEHHTYAVNMAARFMGAGRKQAPLPGATRSSLHYYALSHPAECDFPMFVTDTRTERQYRRSNDPALHCLMEPTQYKALVTWLLRAHRKYPQAPKFIISGSIIAPLATRYCLEPSTWRQQDGWAGYPATMEALLTLIAGKHIQKVVFVGGDAHLSAVSRLTLKLRGEAPGTEAWQIVSSGLYAPLPFANAHVEDYLWSQSHALPVHHQKALSIECTNTLLSDHYSQFVRVDATVDEVTVACFDEANTERARQTLFRQNCSPCA